jgi:RNA polymerase sigma-70 factor (ECF subfamily)
MTSEPAEPAASILERVAAGDSTAVQDCINRYGGLVWSIARDLTRTAADAEDAVQEVFLSVWKNAPRFDATKASEKTFIAMIARRRLIDSLRKAGRRPQLVALPEDGPDPADNSHIATQHGAEAEVAKRLLKELRPEQRQVIELSVYQGMSHSEISTATRIPIGTVKSHIWRGLNAVRSRLTELDEATETART